MFYEGISQFSKDKQETSICLAISKDGLSDWKVYEKPILTSSESSSNFDSESVGSPQPFFMQENKIRLYFCGR